MASGPTISRIAIADPAAPAPAPPAGERHPRIAPHDRNGTGPA